MAGDFRITDGPKPHKQLSFQSGRPALGRDSADNSAVFAAEGKAAELPTFRQSVSAPLDSKFERKLQIDILAAMLSSKPDQLTSQEHGLLWKLIDAGLNTNNLTPQTLQKLQNDWVNNRSALLQYRAADAHNYVRNLNANALEDTANDSLSTPNLLEEDGFRIAGFDWSNLLEQFSFDLATKSDRPDAMEVKKAIEAKITEFRIKINDTAMPRLNEHLSQLTPMTDRLSEIEFKMGDGKPIADSFREESLEALEEAEALLAELEPEKISGHDWIVYEAAEIRREINHAGRLPSRESKALRKKLRAATTEHLGYQKVLTEKRAELETWVSELRTRLDQAPKLLERDAPELTAFFQDLRRYNPEFDPDGEILEDITTRLEKLRGNSAQSAYYSLKDFYVSDGYVEKVDQAVQEFARLDEQLAYEPELKAFMTDVERYDPQSEEAVADFSQLEASLQQLRQTVHKYGKDLPVTGEYLRKLNQAIQGFADLKKREAIRKIQIIADKTQEAFKDKKIKVVAIDPPGTYETDVTNAPVIIGYEWKRSSGSGVKTTRIDSMTVGEILKMSDEQVLKLDPGRFFNRNDFAYMAPLSPEVN
ncbi:MAG: hypothetical protein KTR14_09320 [Vampirovibrio sp.]|nr:hypothetical protein [Vampirovibrio sp.]